MLLIMLLGQGYNSQHSINARIKYGRYVVKYMIAEIYWPVSDVKNPILPVKPFAQR